MPTMTAARYFATTLAGYGVSHVFFVPAILMKTFAEMEDLPIRRVMVHGEKAAMPGRAASRGCASPRTSVPRTSRRACAIPTWPARR